MSEARATFHQLRARGGTLDPRVLDEVWAGLDPVAVADILGEWKGGDFDTGHPISRQLSKARWYGKTFVSAADAKPLVCLDGAGNRYSDVELGGGGEASLWMVEFRGEVTATMVYDARPVLDHFKQVDDRTLMGIMNGKSVTYRGEHFYFYLERA